MVSSDVDWVNIYKGVDPLTVKGISQYLGSLYINYSSDPIQKVAMLAMCLLACGQFFVGDNDNLEIGLNKLMGLFNI
jgi:hypothetical protein